MKIVIATGIYPPDVGGPATYTRAMACALSDAGHVVEVVCYADAGYKALSTGYNEDAFIVHRVKRSILPIRYIVFAWKTFLAARKMDLVYLQGPVSEGFPGTIGAIFARKPTVMKIVGDYAWEMYMQESGNDKVLLDEFIQADVGARLWRSPGPGRAPGKSIKIRLIEMIERWTAKRAKKIITPSVYLKGIVERWGVPVDKVKVIYNPIYSMPQVRDRTFLREKFGLGSERVILTAVRAVPWKNIDFIIRLLPSLPAETMFVIAGDGPSLEAWKRVAEKQGIQQKVRFVGKLSKNDLAEWYRVADCFVLPSGYEGFAHVVGEAVTMHCPCFVSDRGGNPEAKTLFGDIVTVLPYLDEGAWIRALSEQVTRCAAGGSRLVPDPTVPPPYANELSFDVMVWNTMKTLEQCVNL